MVADQKASSNFYICLCVLSVSSACLRRIFLVIFLDSFPWFLKVLDFLPVSIFYSALQIVSHICSFFLDLDLKPSDSIIKPEVVVGSSDWPLGARVSV